MTNSALKNLSKQLDESLKFNAFTVKADSNYWYGFSSIFLHRLFPSSSCLKVLIISQANAYPREIHQKKSIRSYAQKNLLSSNDNFYDNCEIFPVK